MSWTIGSVLDWAAGDLGARGLNAPRLDAELMLAQVLGCDRIKLIIESKRPLERAELEAYKLLHKRRRQGEPVAYLRGEREFYGRPFVVDKRVLVPRPETELLVEVALGRTRHLSLCARVLDLCTGSGCVAVTLKKERPTTRVAASDLSAAALEVAWHNCLRLGALISLVRSDCYQALGALRGRLDLITANPPYVGERERDELPPDVRDFEPPEALFAGTDGLAVARRIVAEAPSMLAPGGVLCLEIGHGQAAETRALFDAAGLAEVKVERDYAGIDRVVSGKRPR